jgi:teichuronic acid biosynthesis glycosyltransferase TuaH
MLVAGSVPYDSPWLTDQNLASAFAQRARVVYVEPPISPLTPFRGGEGTSVRSPVASLTRGCEPRPDGVTVTRPWALPPLEHPISRRISTPLIKTQLRRSTAFLGPVIDVALVTRRLPLPRTRVVCHLVKDWTPAGADLIGRSESDLINEILEISASADLVLAISTALQRKLAEHGIASRLLRHGFHASLATAYDAARIPADLAALPRPRFVYAGRIDGRLDMGLLESLAGRFRSGSVVLVGPVSPRLRDGTAVGRLFARPNVHRLGRRDRLSLPAYLVHADCLLLPYAQREWSRFGSPLKLWDYLYAGPPLVGTGYTVLGEYPPPLVHYADDPADFLVGVDQALTERFAGASTRRKFALANTWEHRADELLSLLPAVTSSR